MKTNFIYGLRAAIGYALPIGVTFLIMITIKIVIGRDLDQYFNTVYFTTITVGFAVAFVSGCFYPSFIKRSTKSDSSKYPEFK